MSKSTVMELPDLLTIEQAAEYLGISRSTLVRWRDTRKVPFIQLPNGRTRFAQRELAEWLISRSRRPR